jgi:plasmid stabilization system protein ParE
LRYRLPAAARAQIDSILANSAVEFGEQAAERYLALIDAAITAVAARPDRPSVRTITGEEELRA